MEEEEGEFKKRLDSKLGQDRTGNVNGFKGSAQPSSLEDMAVRNQLKRGWLKRCFHIRNPKCEGVGVN